MVSWLLKIVAFFNLLFAYIQCTVYVISLSLQQYYYYYTNEPVVHLDFVGFICSMFAIGLAIGVTIAVGMLFFIQVSKLVPCLLMTMHRQLFKMLCCVNTMKYFEYWPHTNVWQIDVYSGMKKNCWHYN